MSLKSRNLWEKNGKKAPLPGTGSHLWDQKSSSVTSTAPVVDAQSRPTIRKHESLWLRSQQFQIIPDGSRRVFLHSCFAVHGQVFPFARARLSSNLACGRCTEEIDAVRLAVSVVVQLSTFGATNRISMLCATVARRGPGTASRRRIGWPALSTRIVGFWVDLGHVANQSEDARDHEAHRNRIRAMIPNMLTFR